MENLTGGNPPVRPLPCVVPCKLYFNTVLTFPPVSARARPRALCLDGDIAAVVRALA